MAITLDSKPLSVANVSVSHGVLISVDSPSTPGPKDIEVDWAVADSDQWNVNCVTDMECLDAHGAQIPRLEEASIEIDVEQAEEKMVITVGEGVGIVSVAEQGSCPLHFSSYPPSLMFLI
jgi:hypothetical protein